MRVRAYGLVVGLDGKGSSNCPKSAFDYLEKEITRMQKGRDPEYEPISPKLMIESPHTAAVLVEAEIPPAATEGSRFDVFVTALDRDVRSISGGKLLPCSLRMILSPENPLEGRILARASGRVFTNPFAKGEDPAAIADQRRGRVLGGGVVLEPRRLQLVMVSPSYSIARQIEREINEYFGLKPKTADAISPNTIRLTVPARYAGREDRFKQVLLHLPLVDSDVMAQMRAKALADELTRSDNPFEDTALALEAMGKSVIPLVQPHYTHWQRATSFYAARVGARLGDDLATAVLRRHAAETDGLFRQQAIRELGEVAGRGAGMEARLALRALLDDPDARIRTAAYEALRERGDAAIRSHRLGAGNFVLDVVQTKGPGLIYARRTQERRIAVFGESLACRPPLFYSYPDRPVTLSADSGQERIVLIRKTGAGGLLFDPVHSGFGVVDLVRILGNDPARRPDGTLEGLGVDYGVVLDVLAELSRSGAMPAEVRLEQPSVTDVLGPAEPLIRPETDEL